MPDDPAWIALLHDLGTMSIMALRAKYAGEANTHRNMLQRVKTCGAVVHPAFRSFPDFLRLVGPKPTSQATLDQIDNHDPEYAPGKVRWADKSTQNRNKGDSLVFTCPNTGRSYTASQLAAKQGVSPTAIRKRRRQAWTDGEIIAGERKALGAMVPSKRVSAPAKSAAPPLTLAQVLFERNREYCEFIRQTEGCEYFICTPAELQAEVADDFPQCRGPEWLRSCEENFLHKKLPQWWKQYGPHIRFHALQPHQQAWVLRIDPRRDRNRNWQTRCNPLILRGFGGGCGGKTRERSRRRHSVCRCHPPSANPVEARKSAPSGVLFFPSVDNPIRLMRVASH